MEDAQCALLKYASVPQGEAEERHAQNVTPSRNKRSEPRNIRVFFSSTFKDMLEERELVAKKVTPALRSFCANRGILFNQVDLRWGITQDQSQSGSSIGICLTEVDKCRPWFVSMLGERYGWSQTESKDELLTKTFANASAKFPWISTFSDRSITELEIRHAALNTSNTRALFFFRDPQYAHARGPDFNESAQNTSKLNRLKGEISDHCTVSDYATPQEFGEKLQEQLLDLISREFPEVPSALSRERAIHHAFASARASSYIGGEPYVYAMNCFLASQVDQPKPLVVIGASGCGKSALLSHFTKRYEDDHTKEFVLAHFIGCSRLSTDLGKMLTRIINEITSRFDLTKEDVASDLRGLCDSFPKYLWEASRHGGMLLVIDAVDQLHDKDLQALRWLPEHFPPHVRLIVSCADTTLAMDTLRERNWRILQVQPLDEATRKNIISAKLQEASKSLSPHHVDRISGVPLAENPLFLCTLLEEVKVHGSFETLDSRIAECTTATDIPALFEIVLSRIEKDLGSSDSLVGDCLVCVLLSRRGLTEGELISILSLAQVVWSELAIALGELLENTSGFYNFTHDHVRQAVRAKYATQQRVSCMQNLLIEYFRGVDRERSCDELPFQLLQGNMMNELGRLVTTPDNFFFLLNNNPFDLYQYFHACKAVGVNAPAMLTAAICETSWMNCGKMLQAGKLLQDLAFYREAEMLFNKGQQVVCHSTEVANVKDALGYLYRLQARYDEACPLFEGALSIQQREYGLESTEVASSMCNLAILYRKMGNFVGAEPLYTKSCEIRSKLLGVYHTETGQSYNGLGCLYQDQGKDKLAEEHFLIALSIRENCNGPNHPDVAMTLTNLASLYLSQAHYDDAERLFTRALHIYESIYGESHPDVAHTLAYLAGVYVERGKYTAANLLFVRAIAIKKALLGPRHPEVAQSLSDMGVLHARMKDYDTALDLYQQCLSIRIEVLGKDHPDTAQSMNNVAAILVDKGMHGEAEHMYKDALAITEAKFGPTHQNVCQTLLKLANLHQRQKKSLSKIEPLYVRSLAILKQHYGEVHPDVALCLNDYAVLKFNAGKTAEAEALYLQMLHTYEKLFPPKVGQLHPDLARAHGNIAAFYTAMGNLAQAHAHTTLAAQEQTAV
eukprot:TRINITY_DN900_c0_g1_i10.p1 TRINITY_DN900_c0_g1~~TRINITY_DN900_c0_g1_i10.p1  ORF type:complete len:1319 (+),score=247.71 TRINITY_DN900_c0_g1_i10:561-3959(+)